jgi:hypothetical protein
MIDVRNTFINFGRFLEKNKIDGQGSIDDYESSLVLEDQRQRTKEYTEFLTFLKEKQDWGNELIIIREEDWNEFHNRINDNEFEMKILDYVQANEFYDKFANLVKINTEEFEDNFVSAKYIDDYTENTIELIININGKDEIFIIDCV